MPGRIRVLVADDSAFMRKNIPKLIESNRDIDVIDVARDGKEAIAKVEELRPDVLTLDVEMPRMNGLATLKYIMKNCPLPVIMISAYTYHQANETIQALESGAVDFVHKPSGAISLDIEKVRDEMIAKIKAATSVNIKRLCAHVRKKVRVARYPYKVPTVLANKVVAIGTSTGGVRALETIVPQFPKEMPVGIVIAQHMPKTFTSVLAGYLNSRSQIKVKEADQGEPITPGVALFAPGGRHLSVRRMFKGGGPACMLSGEPSDALYIPSVDIMMESVTEAYGSNSIGVVLTGMGNDGTKGLRAIKRRSGKTIAESESSSVVFGMPRAAIEQEVVDRVLPLTNIPRAVMGML